MKFACAFPPTIALVKQEIIATLQYLFYIHLKNIAYILVCVSIFALILHYLGI